MQTELPFTLAKTRAGKIRVKYACATCGEKLESEIFEAGDNDTCPACQAPFTVPGKRKRAEVEEELRRINKQQQIERQAQEKARKEQAVRDAQIRAEQAKMIEAIDVEQSAKEEQNRLAAAAQREKEKDLEIHTAENTSYPALEAYMTGMRVVGWLICVAWICIPSAMIITGVIANSPEMFFNGTVTLVGLGLICLPVAFSFFVGSQLVRLAIDARLDIAKLVQKRSGT